MRIMRELPQVGRLLTNDFLPPSVNHRRLFLQKPARPRSTLSVTPAEAGVSGDGAMALRQVRSQRFPASAWDASLRWHDGQDVYPLLQEYVCSYRQLPTHPLPTRCACGDGGRWVPAFAGMTGGVAYAVCIAICGSLRWHPPQPQREGLWKCPAPLSPARWAGPRSPCAARRSSFGRSWRILHCRLRCGCGRGSRRRRWG